MITQQMKDEYTTLALTAADMWKAAQDMIAKSLPAEHAANGFNWRYHVEEGAMGDLFDYLDNADNQPYPPQITFTGRTTLTAVKAMMVRNRRVIKDLSKMGVTIKLWD